MAFVTGLDATLKRLEARKKRPREIMSMRIRSVVFALHQQVLAHTPVNTGATVVNYIWSMDTPVIETKEPHPDGETRGTNSMPLGVEPRRLANEQEATETLMSLDYSYPFRRYYMTNTSEAIMGLEAGLLPIDPHFTPRSPHGMVGLSVAYVHALMEAGQL